MPWFLIILVKNAYTFKKVEIVHKKVFGFGVNLDVHFRYRDLRELPARGISHLSFEDLEGIGSRAKEGGVVSLSSCLQMQSWVVLGK